MTHESKAESIVMKWSKNISNCNRIFKVLLRTPFPSAPIPWKWWTAFHKEWTPGRRSKIGKYEEKFQVPKRFQHFIGKPNTHHYRYEICISLIAYRIDSDLLTNKCSIGQRFWNKNKSHNINETGSFSSYKLWYNSNARQWLHKSTNM